jgi:hypothetical protein
MAGFSGREVRSPKRASKITDRMPAILRREDWTTWLGETDASPAEVKSVLLRSEDGGNWTMSNSLPGIEATEIRFARKLILAA